MVEKRLSKYSIFSLFFYYLKQIIFIICNWEEVIKERAWYFRNNILIGWVEINGSWSILSQTVRVSKVLKVGLIKLKVPKTSKHRFILKTLEDIWSIKLHALTLETNRGHQEFGRTNFVYTH